MFSIIIDDFNFILISKTMNDMKAYIDTRNNKPFLEERKKILFSCNGQKLYVFLF